MTHLKLIARDRKQLQAMTRKGTHSARTLNRARILLLSGQGESDVKIANTLRVGRMTVYRIKKRYAGKGLHAALQEKPRPGQPQKYTEQDKADIIALACSAPPKGAQRWSLSLLVEESAAQTGKNTRRESVRLILKKAGLSLG